jgi:hypothetical protein
MHMKKSTPKVLWLSVVGALVLIAVLLYACAPVATPEPTPMPSPIPPTATPTPLPDQSKEWADWEAGPHSADYDLGKGPNTMCTRCHSPQNWIPGSKAAKAPNCVTCKFPTDKELRIAPSFAEGGMDLVTEDQWVGIPCAQCHVVDENGIANPELAWLAPISLTYEEINIPNELCEKCHTNAAGAKVSSAGLSANHEVILGGSAHLNYAGEWPQADRPKYCTDCHNAHTGETKQCVDCHTDTADTHTRVSAMMDKVTCMACHDASKSQVGFAVEGGPFTTILTSPGRGGGPATVSAVVSHSVVYMVSCNRCHYENNPWGLTVLTAAGQVPPAPTATPKP